MWCAKCNRDLIFCKCLDIEERLSKGLDSPAAPAIAMNLFAREKAQDNGLIDCSDYIGKNVIVTFESKRYDGVYNQTGKLVYFDSRFAEFENIVETNYPEGEIIYLTTSRIRGIKNIMNGLGRD